MAGKESSTWHTDDFDRLCSQLETCPIKGLTSSVAAKRLALNGKNKMSLPERPGFRCVRFAKNCFRGLASTVFIAIIFCYILYYVEQENPTDRHAENEYLTVTIILLIVFLVSGLLRYIQENDDYLVAWAFMELMPMYCTVVRDGRMQIIRSENVVVGDILIIAYGERIAADVRIFYSEDLEVDNVALTGYSTSVTIIPDVTHQDKWISRNVGLACSHVTQGSGRGLVIACGDDSEVGIMARLSMEPRPLTRPRKNMKQVVFYRYVIWFIMLGVIVISITITGLSIPNLLEFYVSLTVSSSPLYVPSLVFIGLWITKNNLTEIGCYVRNMESVSTLGLTTVICSNLLGSMTQRTWQISELFVDGELLNVQSYFDETDHFRHLIRASVLCNHANFAPGQRGLPANQQTLDGTDYEKAVIKFAIRFVENLHVLRVKHKRVACKSVDTISHLQVSVHMTVNDDDEMEYYLYIRGHWNEVMDHCTTCYMDNEAEPVELSADLQSEVVSHGLQLEKLGRHTYAFASKRLEADDYMLSLISNSFSYSNKNTFLSFMKMYSDSMCFLGLIAAQNPPYPHVIDAIAQCRTAGIKLVFMTRTGVNFARAIARAVGVFGEDSDIADMAERFNMALPRVEHREVTAITVNMQNMSTQGHHQRWNIEQLLLSHVDVVFSRIAVAQRYLIIDTCLQLGAVVTAIGSSVHDTSAIRCANVGVSESASSHVSQSCADIIVLENNFVTVVRAIAESRLLFENQKKALVYGLATNMSMIVIHFLFVVLQMPFRMPLVPLLFISFFVNMIPASTLFYEPPEFDLMNVLPRVNEDFLINRRMLFVSYINVGVLEASAVVLAYIVYMLRNGFLPGALFGLSAKWYDDSLNDMTDSYGQEWTRSARLQLEYEMTSVIVITLTLMQGVNLVMCKTSRINLLTHGFGNLRLNLALVYMIGICFIFTFTSAPEQLQSLPVNYLPIFLYVFPLAILTVILETMRRYLVRKYPGCWLEEVSYYGCL
ncbi:sodium/potassium-transporting ATPase subunit alpha [Drosophila mojavensis]|uniref:Cation-transporting P-type ATPase N-terminal domain-containing protein n=1 Tax=Drosophila mojavensis TaxID=7230 RepID=B4KT29_DROMO|nr:sodium/potassium-transporting ATPase subunit alpha [Drosophila mojavensis]EDW09549.2 uncharacterized protein Dmoj_GI18976 [Drosophila mojavensis]